MGWDAKEGESHTDKLMRATVMGLADAFAWDDAGVAAEARRRFDAHWEDPSVLPAEYKVNPHRYLYVDKLERVGINRSETWRM